MNYGSCHKRGEGVEGGISELFAMKVKTFTLTI